MTDDARRRADDDRWDDVRRELTSINDKLTQVAVMQSQINDMRDDHSRLREWVNSLDERVQTLRLAVNSNAMVASAGGRIVWAVVGAVLAGIASLIVWMTKGHG